MPGIAPVNGVAERKGQHVKHAQLLILLTLALVCVGAAGASAVQQAPLDLLKGPYLQSVTTDSIVVSWETSEPSDSLVDYGLTAQYTHKMYDDTESELHEVRLTGLEAGTSYHYQVTSVRGDEMVSSGDGVFQSAVEAGTPFRFAAYGDTRSNPEDHASVVKGIIASEPRFVIHTGDFVARGTEYKRWDREFFGPAAPMLRNIPLFPCLGNHEDNAAWYYYFFDTPEGGGDHGERWYAFDYGSAHFTVVDTDTDFSAGSAQYAWLEEDLRSTRSGWLFVVHHHPAYSSGPHGGNGAVQEHLVPLYEAHGVAAVFQGHDHIYERSYKDGVYYIVTGGGGAPRYDCQQKPNPYHQCCGSDLHYCILDIYGATAAFHAHRADGTVLDSIVFRSSRMAPELDYRGDEGGPPIISTPSAEPFSLF